MDPEWNKERREPREESGGTPIFGGELRKSLNNDLKETASDIGGNQKIKKKEVPSEC